MDQPWWPDEWRRMETDFLRTLNTLARSCTPLVAPVTALLRETGHRRIIDLCSGGGGLVLPLRAAVATALGEPIDLVLTDLFPNPSVLGHLPDRTGITYLPTPVDACSVPPALTGLRTISLGLHHLRPLDVARVFEDAARSRQPIVAFEGTARSLPLAASMTLLPIAATALAPLSRPRSLRRLLWHTAIPVVPLALGWDAICSCLRSYEPDELRKIVEPFQSAEYGLVVRRERWLGVPITSVIGTPTLRRSPNNAPVH